MDNFLTVFSQTQTEYEEKRSRFIATLRHCETEDEANAFLEEMRSKYWDARHNVFAYSVEGGRVCRFSDDGEPHGTAGKPMLDVILGSGITNIAVVVTRYFGGVLLGTGGLVRAYSKSTQDVLQKSEIFTVIPCTAFSIACDYTDHGKLVNLINSYESTVEDTKFTDKVEIIFYLKDRDVNDFCKKLSEIFSARLKAKEINKKLVPFKNK